MTTRWQEFDCPYTEIDFDLEGDAMVVPGGTISCLGCGGTHVVDDKLPINEYESENEAEPPKSVPIGTWRGALS